MATRTATQSPALPVGDSHDLIRVQSARVNNPKRGTPLWRLIK